MNWNNPEARQKMYEDVFYGNTIYTLYKEKLQGCRDKDPKVYFKPGERLQEQNVTIVRTYSFETLASQSFRLLLKVILDKYTKSILRNMRYADGQPWSDEVGRQLLMSDIGYRVPFSDDLYQRWVERDMETKEPLFSFTGIRLKTARMTSGYLLQDKEHSWEGVEESILFGAYAQLQIAEGQRVKLKGDGRKSAREWVTPSIPSSWKISIDRVKEYLQEPLRWLL